MSCSNTALFNTLYYFFVQKMNYFFDQMHFKPTSCSKENWVFQLLQLSLCQSTLSAARKNSKMKKKMFDSFFKRLHYFQEKNSSFFCPFCRKLNGLNGVTYAMEVQFCKNKQWKQCWEWYGCNKKNYFATILCVTNLSSPNNTILRFFLPLFVQFFFFNVGII